MLGIAKEYRVNRTFGYLKNRVKAINEDMVELFLSSDLAMLGDISISGTIINVEELANTLQVCLDNGAKKVFLPITATANLESVLSDLVGVFSLIFYATP